MTDFVFLMAFLLDNIVRHFLLTLTGPFQSLALS